MLRVKQTIKHNPAERTLRRRLYLIRFHKVKRRLPQDIKNPSLHMVPMSVIAVMISLNANYVKTLNYDEN